MKVYVLTETTVKSRSNPNGISVAPKVFRSRLMAGHEMRKRHEAMKSHPDVFACSNADESLAWATFYDDHTILWEIQEVDVVE